MVKCRVIVFDLDGVLLESAEIKTEAFRIIFANLPHFLDQIITYHKENGGLSRYKKFEYIYQNILKKPYDDKIKVELGKKFQELVVEKVLTCPLVEGTLELLNKYHKKIPMYIISGTPDLELKEILQKRDLLKYFTDIFGSSKEKSEWLRYIIQKEKIQAKELMFIGDSISDYRAGINTKINFIGRIIKGEKNIFLDRSIPIIHDLKELPELLKK